MKAILNNENVVVALSENGEIVENGISMNGVIFAEQGLRLIETDLNVEVQKHKIIDGTIVDNPNYRPIPPTKDGQQQQLLIEDLNNIKNTLASPHNKFNAAIELNTDIETLQALKINVLKEDCNNAIYKGFISGTLNKSFGFNEHDQANFTQQMLLIVASNGNYTTPIKWKTVEGEIVTLTTEQFLTVVNEATAHKVSNQEKYWQLEGQVLACLTKEEILQINW